MKAKELYSEYSSSPIEFMKKNNLGTTKETTIFLMEKYAESQAPNKRMISDEEIERFKRLGEYITERIVSNYSISELSSDIKAFVDVESSKLSPQETSDNWVKCSDIKLIDGQEVIFKSIYFKYKEFGIIQNGGKHIYLPSNDDSVNIKLVEKIFILPKDIQK